MTTRHNDATWNTNASTALLAGALSLVLVLGGLGVVAPQGASSTKAPDDPCKDDQRYAFDVDLSTGTDNGNRIAIGNSDPDWTSDHGSVSAVNPDSKWYTDPDTRWVNPHGGTWGPSNEDYVYTTSFTIDSSTADRVEIHIEVASDDKSHAFLKGSDNSNVPFGRDNSFSGDAPATFTASIPANADTYTLRLETHNALGPTGINVDGIAKVTCKGREDPCDELGGYQLDISTGRSNGTADSFGAVDDDWIVTQAPDGAGPEAYSIQPHPWNVWRSSAQANWINPYGDEQNDDPRYGNNNEAPVGDYVYENTIHVPPGAEQLVLAFDWWVDDKATIELVDDTGDSTTLDPGPGGPTNGRTVTHTETGTLSSTYTIRAHVHNAQTFTGLLVEDTGSFVDCCNDAHPSQGDDLLAR